MTVALPLDSRYKDSFSYVDNGAVVIGPMQPPPEFSRVSPRWTIHTVTSREVGFPDIIASRYYGDGSEKFWWVICLVNGIVNPDTDLYPGQKLSIPPQDLVTSFANRTSRADRQ